MLSLYPPDHGHLASSGRGGRGTKRPRVSDPSGLDRAIESHERTQDSADIIKAKLDSLQARDASRVTKPTLQTKLSRKQRQRREQLAARAESILDKREKDIHVSQKKAHTIKRRRVGVSSSCVKNNVVTSSQGDWHEVNDKINKNTAAEDHPTTKDGRREIRRDQVIEAGSAGRECERSFDADPPRMAASQETALELRPKIDDIDGIK